MAMLLVAISLSAQTELPVRYVSIQKGSYANNGRSWEMAKNNLQDAIEDLRKYMAENMLKEGHVYVAAGTYTPTTATPGGDGTLYTSFILYDGIRVYGGFNPDAPEARPEDRILEDDNTIGNSAGARWKLKYRTVLSGNHTHATTDPLQWDAGRNEYTESYTGNSYHVVWFASAGLDRQTNRAAGLEEVAALDGFTIRDGYAMNRITPTVDDGRHAYHNSYGGGVYMVANSEVRNCIITQNASTLRGGGVYMDGGGLLEQCYVTRNQSAGVGVTDGYGGGVAMDDGGMVRHCIIENNVGRAGGGLSLFYSHVPETDKERYAAAVVGTVINNNTSTAEAGGVYMRNGGVLNHVSIVRNKCVGVSVVYNNRRYARSGGLYVDGGAFAVNSVIWGNEVAANNNVQYATFRETSKDTKTTLAYVALSRYNYVDWSGTIKKTNGVYSLAEDNSNSAVESYYPEFTAPAATAGVYTEGDTPDWTPLFYSCLRHKGMQINDYPMADNIGHAHVTNDLTGNVFAPRCMLGALMSFSRDGEFAMVEDLEGSGRTIRTIFVEPSEGSNTSLTGMNPKMGGSWENPFHYINDAIGYINKLTGDEAPSEESPVQLVVKEGVTTTTGNAYMSHLRATTITVPSNVRLYGGFSESLTGTDVSIRDPKKTPTRITANIIGGNYEDNGTHIIIIGHGTSHAVVDGFQLYFANTQTNEVLTSLGLQAGAGLAVLNSVTSPLTGKETQAMHGNIVRNCVIANCTAPQGAAVYMSNSSGKEMQLKMENCIFHNNSVLHADSAIVAAVGDRIDLELNHCLIRGNIGYAVMAKDGAQISVKNTALHANIRYDGTGNIKIADLKATEDAADPRVLTFSEVNNGRITTGDVTAANNMMDIGIKDFNDIARPVLRYHSTYVSEYPNFVNATNNIGVNKDGDITVYGGDTDWMPTNNNPMVNAAGDDDNGMNAYDMTGNTTRNYGGAADIGALENTYQPEFGRVIYVRDYGNTTEPGGDGSSWEKAINGNSLDVRYKNNHGFEGVDAELYPEGEQLTGLQWAVDEAFYRSLERDGGNNVKYINKTVTSFNKGSFSSTFKKDIKCTTVDGNKRVAVWVAEGEYLRRKGFFMRNGVDVYGGFSNEGSPGMKERDPKKHETIIETNTDDEASIVYDEKGQPTGYNVEGNGQWGPSVYDFNDAKNGPKPSEKYEAQVIDDGGTNSSYPAKNCLDGSTSTQWRPVNRNTDAWVVIDLGRVEFVDKLEVQFSSSIYRTGDYTVKYSLEQKSADDFTTVSNLSADLPALSGNATVSFDKIACRYLYIMLHSGTAFRLQEIYIKNGDTTIPNSITVSLAPEYDLNNYQDAYKTQRVLTQPFPYYENDNFTDLEKKNIPVNGFDYETSWDGFIIQNGRARISHGRDGGAGAAIRENGRLANCIIRKNVLEAGGFQLRSGGVFQNGGVLENCVIEKNILSGTRTKAESNNLGSTSGVFGGALYQRTGTVFNCSFAKNILMGKDGCSLQGAAIFFENGRFYNNTVIDNVGPYTIYSGNYFSDGRIDIYNTIICNNNSGTTKEFDCTTGGGYITLKNCMFDSSNDHKAFDNSYVNVDASSFRYIDNTVGSVDMVFVDPNGNYRLLSTAPAINAGTDRLGLDITDTKDIELPSYDADFTNRVKDCIVDIGAYEYNGAQDIKPDTKTEGYAFYYIIPHGTGNASADSPQNAACWRKLQKVLDAAGRYVYEHRDDLSRRKVVIKLAGDSKKDRTINGKTVNGYEGFTYRPSRSNKIISPGEEENQRDYSLIVPHGVEVWGGYHEDFEETKEVDGKNVTVEKRDILEYRTSFSGIFQYDDVNVQAYNVVTFTNNTYDADGELMVEDGLKDIRERTVLDGIIIENGRADGELDETRVGAGAIVTGYAHIRNCIVQNNTATDMGGGLYMKPGALVTGSIIQYNATNGNGGGVYVEEEPERTTAPNHARIYTSDIIYNTAAHAGGGIYFKTNLRANSSLFWHNTGSELANIAGETMPTDVGNEVPGINDYPISFCATETTREPGIDNIIVNTDINKGVRFEKEDYNHNYVAADGTQVEVMHNDYEFYKVGKYSLIVRSGMAYSDYAKLMSGQDGIIVEDIAGVDRMGYDNEFIDIGARAYPGVVLPEVDDEKLMTRIFVAKSEDEVSMDAVNVMRNQTGYYSQEGSSFAYPMRYFGDALEYVRTIRKKKTPDGKYKYKDETFEIVLSGGTYYPRRNIRGEYVNSRGCTFLVPEGVTIVGGVNVQNDGVYYGNVPEKEGESATEFSYEGNSVTIKHATLHEIISNRKLHDINHNSIAEPWEMEVQTIFSGQVINSSTSHNVYHVMTCVADEDFVGGLPTPTFDYTDKVDGQTAGGGTIPKHRGRPIIIDGVNMEDGMALDYQEAAVNSRYTYFKGGAICVEGNWTTGMKFMNHNTEAQEQDYSPVGFRNIPLELRNCTFMNNGGGRGGAIYTDGELKVFACNFAQNYARVGADTFEDGKRMSYAGRGGAINASYETIIINSIFANNEADPNGDTKTLSGVGGAVLLSNYAKLHVLNCDFVRNLAAGYPAIFCYQANKGITEANKGDVELLRADNPHKVINSIFWGNKSMDSGMDKVINFHGYSDGSNSDTVYPEALWFCAYEEGKGNKPVYSQNNIDYRLQNYEGYILSPDDSDRKYTSNGTYIPYLWKDKYKELDIDNKTVIDGVGQNPDVVDGMNPVTNNIIINSDNNAIDGPNFISPSTEAGKAGFYISADWMIGRINNLVDNGWTYLQQDLSDEDPDFCYKDGKIVGSGIYLSASYDYGKLSGARTAIPIGKDLYMSYSEGTGKPISRVSSDPNPTHHQTFIDIGVYEYQHVKLEPFIYDEVDVLWVTEREKTGGVSDGKTWATASSDLQRAIETLLASRNGHDKEIRMLEGNYQPVYTINGNLAFTVTTDVQTGITLPDDEKHGVRSLTIRGGYSKELEGQENVENYPVCLYASERTGGDLNFDHVFVIDDMRQRFSQKIGADIITEDKNYVIPVVLKGLNFSNTKAKNGNDGGVAVFYNAQFVSTPTYWKDNDICADNTGEELYKLTMSQCSFFNNGSQEEASAPAVTIGKDNAGKALIYNSLFHSNKGNPLMAFNTKVVNCTFALNDRPILFVGKESELHNSILWRNNLMGEESGDVLGLSNAGGKEMMTNNAISSLADADGYNNVPLSLNNSDALSGPNFFNPMDVADGNTAFDASLVATVRDFHVNPSSLVLSKGNVDKYVGLVKNLNGVYPYAGTDNIERVKRDKDMADVTRYYGSGLERGAYECVAIMNRVLYVNPNNAIPGNGDSWEKPYGKGQIQTAIDAAAVYYDVNDKKNAFVFVKGNGEHTGESLMMREGVSLYGSIDLTCNAEVKRETDGTYLDDKISAYIMSELPSYRKGMAMSNHTIVGGVKADADVRFCVYDGLEIGDKDDASTIAERTEPVVEFGDNSTVALVNSIISNNRVADGVNLIDNRSGLLYNILVRDNGRADVALGSGGYALNCTFAGDNGSWTNLSATPGHSINNIMYRDGDQMMPFAPYFRQSDVAYHADEVPNKDNRNLWYQLHEKAPYIGVGTNGDGSGGKSLLPESLQSYVDFASDRDLLGNPRVLGKNIDMGCYETWSTGYYSPSSDDMVAENLFANMNRTSYSGHHYPHEGSVVYLQNNGKLVCELKDDKTPYFTTDSPLRPGYLLAMEGGSLYGQGNEIRLPYVAAERKMTGRYALVALPFATVNDGKYVTRTSYNVEADGMVTALNEETTDYTKYRYDGEARSQWNYEYNADNSTCWKSLDTHGVIDANDGYLLDRGGQGEETLRFTAFDKVSAPYKEGAEDKTVTLTQYDQSIAGTGDFRFTSEYNMGWNLKGMPYLISGYDTGKIGGDGKEAMFVPHVMYTMSGEGRYITEYSWKLNANVPSVSPCHAFFTQTAVIGDGKTETLHFSKPCYDSSLSEEMPSRMPSLAISGEGYGKDEVIICPDGYLDAAYEGNSRMADSESHDISVGSLDYCFGADGVKFAALNDTLPQIYVSGTDGVGLSLLSHAPMGVEIPLIVEVKGKASYTFSLSDRGTFSAYSDVYIRDNETGTVTSLISGDYTVEISPADSPSRFSLFLGEDTDGIRNQKCNMLYNVNGMRVKRPYSNGVYIEVGDKARKVLRVR